MSNSTPPPATSPVPVKIKAEPISPPRDVLNNHAAHAASSGGGSGGMSSNGNNQSTVTSINLVTHGSSASVLNSSNALNAHVPPQHLLSTRPSSTGHLTSPSGESATLLSITSF